MTSRAENELLTHTGPGTPCGELMRRYWQPAALAEELPGGGAPLPIRLLGEDLVLFRDEGGQPALLGIHCSHRGADLSYGRLEDGGLRCIYHGWLYDREGRCLEQPGEPAGSTFHERIRHRAYPCREVGGLVLAYMGPGEPPLVPAYEAFAVPEDQRFVTKILQECNYLQGNEGNIDPIHLGFLHRRLAVGHGEGSFADSRVPPHVDAEETEFGVRVYGVRRIDEERNFVTIRNFIMPDLTLTSSAGINWHVPIDDTHHWKYSVVYKTTGAIDAQQVRSLRSEVNEGYRLARNRRNRFLQDREEMRTLTFSGLGTSFQAHDTCATEGEGVIQDRAAEHLAPSDLPLILARRMLLRAIRDVQEGRDPPHVIRTPEANRLESLVSANGPAPASTDWRTWWQRAPRYESGDAGGATSSVSGT